MLIMFVLMMGSYTMFSFKKSKILLECIERRKTHGDILCVLIVIFLIPEAEFHKSHFIEHVFKSSWTTLNLLGIT